MTSPPPEPDLSALFAEIPDPGTAPGPTRSPIPIRASTGSPARSSLRNRRLAALTASAAWLSTHLAVYGVRSDLRGLPVSYVAAQVLLPFLIAVSSLVLALSSGKLGLGRKIGSIVGLSVLGPAAFCVLALGAPPPSTADADAASALGMLVCFDITVAWTAVPLIAAGLALPGVFASGVRWRSALLGAAVGLFAGATMNLHCANVAPLHMLMGHGSPVLVATLLGALVLGYRTRA